MPLSRRQFLYWSAGFAGTVLTHPLQGCSRSIGFGALQPDPNRILDLPVGFRYRVLSQFGDRMQDNALVPSGHDGMAAFADRRGNTVLIRNHELTPDSGTELSAGAEQRYDPTCKGGTTTLVVSPDRQLLSQYTSLVGTVRNCGGGATPWGSWISSEEDTSTPTSNSLVSKPHGYNFEVPSTATAPVKPEPLVAMGRFRHEAIAIDPHTGIVYQTEDQGDGLFYRFIPQQPGDLRSGVLEALKIRDQPQLNTAKGMVVGRSLPVEWVRIEDVDPTDDTVRVEGFAKGATQFSRGEGICYSNGTFYFVCTNGGNQPYGQVWRYQPGNSIEAGGTLELFIQPDNQAAIDLPDNLIMAPWGDLLLCEDGEGEQRVIGVTPQGDLYPFARNALNGAEFAGVCFSPDGSTMFLNIYNPGLTLAVWGDRMG
ncbi:MAG: DUF839 domain-containing protein [Leptolyngbyaceae cyanobacterium SL_7_1]|nr:DUF839 domain-containing protein [Leptolyngbyaceae cyanobacterium SL_7_1]